MGDNGQIIKLVYVHEGYEEAEGKRKHLKEVVYFGFPVGWWKLDEEGDRNAGRKLCSG